MGDNLGGRMTSPGEYFPLGKYQVDDGANHVNGRCDVEHNLPLTSRFLEMSKTRRRNKLSRFTPATLFIVLLNFYRRLLQSLFPHFPTSSSFPLYLPHLVSLSLSQTVIRISVKLTLFLVTASTNVKFTFFIVTVSTSVKLTLLLVTVSTSVKLTLFLVSLNECKTYIVISKSTDQERTQKPRNCTESVCDGQQYTWR